MSDLTSNPASIPEIYAWVRTLFGGRFPSMDELATAFYQRAHETPADGAVNICQGCRQPMSACVCASLLKTGAQP